MSTENKSIADVLWETNNKVSRLEARILLAHLLKKPIEYLIAHSDEVLDELNIVFFELLVAQRASGTPIPYITGRQEFYGRYFSVDPSVLIPRPDTEVLIEQAQKLAPDQPKVLDLGTGSGCIAITLALELANTQVWATDFSADALSTAKLNAQNLNASVTFSQGSWWDAVDPKSRFDLIVSNPPYIEANDEHLSQLSFEPLSALTDGSTGLTDLEEIILNAPFHLEHRGWLIVEHGYDQAQAVQALFQEAGFCSIKTQKDYGNNDRITFGCFVQQ